MAVIYTGLLFVLAVSGGAFADKVEECYSECGRTRECSALGSLPRTKVPRCMKFLHSQCENLQDYFKCLDDNISTRKSGCTGNIVRNAIPCLKCEARCEELDFDDSPPAIGDNSEEEKKCYETCDKTRECFVFYSAKPKQKKRCESYTNTMCGRNMHPIECFERLKNKEHVGCSKLYRRNGLTCLKCGDNCARQYYAENENEDDKKCNDECSKTQSCIVFETATEQRIGDCRKMSEGMCSVETHPITCLESLKSVSNEICPKGFRDHLIACMKCDVNCSEKNTAPSGGPPQFLENEVAKCMATCDSTGACLALDSATKAKEDACDNFLNSMCDEEEAGTPCLDKLNKTASNDCSLEFRKSMTDCFKCEGKCDEVHGNNELSKDVEICLEACSNVSSCIAMENSSDKALDDCENLFQRQCGNNDDIMSCMESYITEVASCPKMLRSKIIDCMKCERRCEQGEIEGSSLSPPTVPSEMPPPHKSPTAMTKKRCEKNCDTFFGCGKRNQIRPECTECTKAQCGSNDISCIVGAIAIDCRTQCLVGNENAKKEMCDTCKANCSNYP